MRDLDQARFDRLIHSRELERLESGWWTRQEAQKVAEVERLLGQPLTYDSCHRRFDALQRERWNLEHEITRIEKNGERLDRAEWSLDARDKAAREVERHESPWGRIRRTFSQNARDDYDRSKRSLGAENKQLEHFRVRDRKDLGEQRQAHSEPVARVPKMEERSRSLSSSMSILDGALEVFRRIAERIRQRELQQERERQRDQDRDRGWER